MAAEPVAPAVRPSIEVVAFGVAADAAVNKAARQSPFFAAVDSAGLPDDLAIQVSDLFAEAIDFHRDLVQGYVCTLVYEMYYPDGMPKPGRILAARFVTPEQHLEAFLFPIGDGGAAYFDARGLDVNRTLRLVDPSREPWVETLDGTALGAAFRRSPLEFSRITSLPAVLRYHPILKTWRAHRGTDYGAAVGTRVRATAEGVVRFAGARGGYGNLVEIRHFGRYTSRYGHLSAFAAGLAAGEKVAKGQVIGKVGMTGLATGPHLHYELDADPGAGRPDKLVFAIRSVPPLLRPAYQSRVRQYRRQFAYANRANLVRLE
jgi:murein DD-endopeptidase MepM/ murein hydrolase activator NlpD